MNAQGSRQIERDAAAWLARRTGDAWTDRDEAAFDAWISASTAHRVAYVRIEAAWTECGRLKALGAGARPGRVPPRVPRTNEPVVEQAPQHAAPRRFRAGWTVAALAVLTLGLTLGWGWRTYFAGEHSTFATAAGEMRTFTLADGTAVTLSSGSVIDVRLTHRERRVDVRRGEAYFSVAHDRRRPFTAAVGARRAVAVGTQFAIRALPDEMRIVVTEGTVRLELQSANPGMPAPSTLLTAGAVATARGNSVLVRPGTVADAERLLSWRSGYLSFHDTPLAAAAAEFNLYGARPLVMGDAAVGQIPIGGNFRWSNSEAFVRLLEDGFGIRVERRADGIVLHSR